MIGMRPVCVECDRAISDDSAFYIESEWVCEGCMETYRRDVTEE